MRLQISGVLVSYFNGVEMDADDIGFLITRIIYVVTLQVKTFHAL